MTHRRTIFRFRGAANRDLAGLVLQRKAERQGEIKRVPGESSADFMSNNPIELTIPSFRDAKATETSRIYASPSARPRNGRFLRRLEPQGVYIGILDDSGGMHALAGQASGFATKAYEFGKKASATASRSHFMDSRNEEAAKPPPRRRHTFEPPP
ncbi:hypothetical protein BDZ89DRAFT_1045589 [Hymenopellis radicata]|nr:hypothetical protein BDZ89DRAFT_1045589 [Hymenopellis radicata]